MARPALVVGAVAVRGLHPQGKSAYQVFAAVRQALAKRERPVRRSGIRDLTSDGCRVHALKRQRDRRRLR